MAAQVTTQTVVQTATITNGPMSNNVRFQGWYIHADEYSLEPINCPTSQSLRTSLTSRYAQCCSLGASTCDDLWTSCYGAEPAGTVTNPCVTGFTCQTVSIFDQFPANGAVVQTQIICGPSNWAASSIYLNVLATSLTTALTTITNSATSSSRSDPQPSETSNVASTAATSTSPASASEPEPSKAWIAGAVIGPIVGIALVALLVWLLFRSRKKQKQKRGTIPAGTTAGGVHGQDGHKAVWAHSGHEAYGAYGNQQNGHEMYEMQGERLNYAPRELAGNEAPKRT